MFVVKHLQRKEDSGKDKARLERGRGVSRLHDRQWLATQVVGGIEDIVRARPALREPVLTTIAETLDAEVRFISTQQAQAATIALFYEHEAERVQEFSRFLGTLIADVVGALPQQNTEAGVLTIEVPLIELVRDAKTLVQHIVDSLMPRHFDGRRLELGAATAAVVIKRLSDVSGMSIEQACERPHRLKWPRQSDQLGRDLVHSYLRDTAIAALLLTPIPVVISDRTRLEHTVITAGTGHGKSRTLEAMIARDLDRPRGEEVGMVVIDSQGDLISRIQKLDVFAGNNRLLLIDASDVEYPVGLNIFDLGGPKLDQLSLREREQAFASTVQLYEYVIGGLFGAEMTQKQSTVFRFLIRLMLSIPRSTIHTLRECLEEPRNFIHVMESLPETSKQFFLNEFLDRQFTDTRKQILRRLYGVLQNPAFERMFASTENRLDLYTALNQGRVVLCNTSRDFLQNECSVFGRYCIAVAMKAAFDRARIPERARRTSFLYIDEASDYFDEGVGQLLVQARKYKLGVVFAHQALEQMSDGLKALVMANTSIKMVGGASAKDARAMAQEMRTSPEFILAQEKRGNTTRFATFVRNVTPSAVSWPIPLATLEGMPVMSANDHRAMLARIRQEVSADPKAQWQSLAKPARVVRLSGVASVAKPTAKPGVAGGAMSDDFSEPY